MDDLNISNDVVKDHLMCLSMDSKLLSNYDSLSTTTKSSFTRSYNKTHTKDLVGKKGGGKKGKGTTVANNEED